MSQFQEASHGEAFGASPPRTAAPVRTPDRSAYGGSYNRLHQPQSPIDFFERALRDSHFQDLESFFRPYDAHEQRYLELWELVQILADHNVQCTEDDLYPLARQIGQSSNSIQMLPLHEELSRQLRMPIGPLERESEFIRRHRTADTTMGLRELARNMSALGLSALDAFREMDNRMSGFLQERDIRGFLRNVPAFIANQVFQFADFNGRGKIGRVEMTQLLNLLIEDQVDWFLGRETPEEEEKNLKTKFLFVLKRALSNKNPP